MTSWDGAARSSQAVEFRTYAVPLRTPYRWAKGTQHERRGLLVRVGVDGAIGFGEVAPPPDLVFEPENLMAEGERLVAGIEPADPGFVAALDERDPPARLRCGITSAWYAARAAAAGRTMSTHLAEVLGVAHDPASQVPVNGLVTENEPSEAATRAVSILRDGMDTIKIKCTEDRELDLRRVASVRSAAPPASLRLDPNESWREDWVEEHLGAMAEFDIEYVEQPLPRTTTLATWAALRAASPVPIAADQSVLGLTELRELLDASAADVMILKAPRLGGPDRVVRAGQMASCRGVPSTVTASLETSVGLLTALHCASLLAPPVPACGLATARFLQRDVGTPPAISQGRMDVPADPGLGLTIEWQAKGSTT